MVVPVSMQTGMRMATGRTILGGPGEWIHERNPHRCELGGSPAWLFRPECLLVVESRIENDVRAWMNRTARHATISDGHWGIIVSVQATQFGDTAWCRLEVVEKLLAAVVGRIGAQKEFKFLPRLNSKGECVLILDGSELRLWQVSKLLLEPLLFNE
jgi:hypothetical protein